MSTTPPPSKSKKVLKKKASVVTITMFHMLCGCLMCYAAFGHEALDSLVTGFGFFRPFWVLEIAGIAIGVHLVGAYLVFCQHTFAFVERLAAGPWPGDFISRELRVGSFALNLFRLTFVCLIIVAAMLFRFFGNNVVGFVGFFGECYLLHTGFGFFEPFRRTVLLDTHLLEETSSPQLGWDVLEKSRVLQENTAQDKMKTPPSFDWKVKQKAWLSHTHSCSPAPTMVAFNRLGMRIGRACQAAPAGRSSHAAPVFSRSGDSSRPPQKLDWFGIMGSTIINRDGSYVISASVMCMEAQYRLGNEKYHGVYSFLLKVRADAIKALKDMCEEKQAWTPNVGAPTVEGVLAVILSLKQGLPTVDANIFLRLQSFESFQVSKLSPLKVTSMLQKIGPLVGVLYADREYFRSTVYRGYRAFPANHAVVCTGYRNIDGELFIIIMDNVAWEGPFRFVLYEAFAAFHVLTVDEL